MTGNPLMDDVWRWLKTEERVALEDGCCFDTPDGPCPNRAPFNMNMTASAVRDDDESGEEVVLVERDHLICDAHLHLVIEATLSWEGP